MHFGVAFQYRHVGAQASRHLRGIEAHDAAADHRNLGGHHAWHTTQQHATTAMYLLQRGCAGLRSEEHTSELQSLMRISYAVFRLKKKTLPPTITPLHTIHTYAPHS